MSWYRTGTVTVTNASDAVTGSGTAWLGVVRPGWGFVGPDGRVYEVLEVTADDALTLARNYAGSNAAGAQYDAFPTQGEIAALADGVSTLLADYAAVRDAAGAGKFSAGSAAAPGVSSTGDTNTGILWPSADSVAIATGGAQRVVVNSSGFVGIGTSAPATPCDVNHATDSRVRLMLGGVGVMQMQAVAGANRLASSNTDPLEFWTNGVRRVLIDSNGNHIKLAQATPPSLTVNNQMVMNLTSNTNLRISVRGSDGVTRVANITLA